MKSMPRKMFQGWARGTAGSPGVAVPAVRVPVRESSSCCSPAGSGRSPSFGTAACQTVIAGG